MKIPFIPLHVMTTGTRNKIAEDAKTEQRTFSSIALSKLLKDNQEMALIIQGATKVKNKTKKQPKKRVRSSSLKLRQNSAKYSFSERSPNMDEEKQDDTVEENQTEETAEEKTEPTRAGMQESPADDSTPEPAPEEPDEKTDDDADDDNDEG